MYRTKYVISKEPRGEIYRRLIDYCTGLGFDFLLVLRNARRAGPSALEVQRRLKPHLIERGQRSEWPGTTIFFGYTALVSRYRSAPFTATVLKGAVRGLYDWIEPELPEDLCFLRPGGEPFLTNTAHEGYASLELDAAEHALLEAAVPGLALDLHQETAPGS